MGAAIDTGRTRPRPARRTRGAGAFMKPHVVVVGAGAFGGWTALYLRRRGARVALLDAWGPGNARASSGGETRVIRATYGPRAIYSRMAARALVLWKEHEARWRRQFYHRIGVLWLVESDDQYEKAALPILRDAKVDFEELAGPEAARRYPQINCERVRWAIFERDGGYLTARRACAAVLDGVRAAGWDYREVADLPPHLKRCWINAVELTQGSAGARVARLPVRGIAGRAFHYRSPPRGGERLAGRWRVRTWVQAWTRGRRARRDGSAGRRTAGRSIPSRAFCQVIHARSSSGISSASNATCRATLPPTSARHIASISPHATWANRFLIRWGRGPDNC